MNSETTALRLPVADKDRGYTIGSIIVTSCEKTVNDAAAVAAAGQSCSELLCTLPPMPNNRHSPPLVDDVQQDDDRVPVVTEVVTEEDPTDVEMDDDDDCALWRVMSEVRRAYSRPAYSTEGDMNITRTETEFTRCFRSYDDVTNLCRSTADIMDLRSKKVAQDGRRSVSAEGTAAVKTHRDVSIASQTQPHISMTSSSLSAISSTNYSSAFRPCSTSRDEQQQRQQHAPSSREPLVDARHVQILLDRVRGGHCISVPPFLRPIEEEDNTHVVGDDCSWSDEGATVKEGFLKNEAENGDVIGTLPVDVSEKDKHQRIHIIDRGNDVIRRLHCQTVIGVETGRAPGKLQMAPCCDSLHDIIDHHSTPLHSASTECLDSVSKITSLAATWQQLQLDCVEYSTDVNQDGTFFSRAVMFCVLLTAIVTFVACLSSVSPSYLIAVVALASFVVNCFELL